MNKPQNIIIYCRISSEELQKTGLGLEAQKNECVRFAEYNNLNIVEIVYEKASGAYPLERRPVLKKALEDAAKLQNGAVIVAKLDRFSRKVSFITAMMDKKVPFFSAEFGLDVPDHMLQSMAVYAEFERARISQRTKDALAVKKAKGEKLGWQSEKYSADKKAVQDKGRAVVVAEADKFALYMKPTIERMRKANMTLQQIADELNSLGVKTQRDGKWWPKSVSNVIERIIAMSYNVA